MSLSYLGSPPKAAGVIHNDFSGLMKLKRTFMTGAVGQIVNKWSEHDRVRFSSLTGKDKHFPMIAKLRGIPVLRKVNLLDNQKRYLFLDYLKENVANEKALGALFSQKPLSTFSLLRHADNITFSRFIHLFATTDALDIVTDPKFIKTVIQEAEVVRAAQLRIMVDKGRRACEILTRQEVLQLFYDGFLNEWAAGPIFELLSAMVNTGKSEILTAPETIATLGRVNNTLRGAICNAVSKGVNLEAILEPHMFELVKHKCDGLWQGPAVGMITLVTKIRKGSQPAQMLTGGTPPGA